MTTTISLIVVLVLGLSVVSDGEVFTALTHLKRLTRLEEVLNEELVEYLQENPDTPVKFHRFLVEIANQTADTNDDVESFLGHPINAFYLIRRLRGGWTDLGKYLAEHDKDTDLFDLIHDHVNKSITKEDALGCIRAIMRIQQVYHIKAKDIADGNLSHKTKTTPLSAIHCFEMGNAFYQWENYKQAYDWFIESLKRMDEQGPDVDRGNLTRATLLEFLAWSEYMTDRVIDALNHTIEILKLDKENDFGTRNIEFFSNEIQKAIEKGSPYERQDPYFKKKRHGKKKEQYMVIYERLCRGKSMKSTREAQKLKCYYDRKRHPMLLIRPLKVEELNEDPYIVVLRDVLYDSEIEYMKKRAAPILTRATVTNNENGDLEFADYRVSKSGWLEDHLHDNNDNILKRINRKASVITGLNAKRTAAEALQIVNYGIAGHYEPHFDHAIESYSSILRMGMGNRIATLLFYMTDVEAGGSTVFIDAETILHPRKGDAAFWYNLMRSGEGDPLTRHAGCPVIVGSKWVCNKWIHEQGQEFIRPCTLSIDD